MYIYTHTNRYTYIHTYIPADQMIMNCAKPIKYAQICTTYAYNMAYSGPHCLSHTYTYTRIDIHTYIPADQMTQDVAKPIQYVLQRSTLCLPHMQWQEHPVYE